MLMKKLIFLAIGLFIFLPFGTTHAQISSLPTADSIIKQINSERTSRGLSPLTSNPALNKAAVARASYLAAKGVLVHVSAPPGEPWPTLKDAGYLYKSAGENLASIPPSSFDVVPEWMASAPHRANILTSNFEDVGIGLAVGPYQGGVAYYVVAYFGEPKDQVLEAKIASENDLINQINTETIKLSKATTKPDKIAIIIKLISLLKTYLTYIEG